MSTLETKTGAAAEPFQPIRPAQIEWIGHTPRATDFGDTYFSLGLGPAESAHVFLQGNRLAERFAAVRAGDLFVLGETGFGTGMNCLLAAACFQQYADPGARLHLLSVERHPLTPADLARALDGWPAPARLAAKLRLEYPPATPGFHALRLADNVHLTLMLGDATRLLEQCRYPVDAWFLDGFAPDRNPGMWHTGLYTQLARLSRPGTTLSTFTAAGHVRRGLAAAGFEIKRAPGFERKREMLTGRRPGTAPTRQPRRGTVNIAGAGLAGATTARALAERGWQVTVVDRAGVAAGASGNRAGVVYTTPSPHLTAQNRYYQSSYLHALRWMQRLGFPADDGDGALAGLVQYATDDRQRRKLRAASISGIWPQTILQRLTDDAIRLPAAGWIRPVAWCRRLLDHPRITLVRGELTALASTSPPALLLRDGRRLEADAAVLCLAGDTAALAGLDWLPLKLIRGQVTFCRARAETLDWQEVHCHAGYLTPAVQGQHCVGATFDLHHPDLAAREQDDAANLAELRRYLPAHWAALGGTEIEVTGHWTGMRCQSTDFLPLCGPLPDTRGQPHRLIDPVYLNIAHGSRGIASTPLAADSIAAALAGEPAPVDADLSAALAPERFLLRQQRRTGRTRR